MLYIFAIVAMIFSLFASIKVNTTFNKYSKMRAVSGLTGYDAARRVLDSNGLYHVQIEQVSGSLTDHYDPRANIIRLSEPVYGVSSQAAIGVAAHEAGHAIQYAANYLPIRLRSAIIPITNIGARLSIPLVMLGLFLMAYSDRFVVLAYLGVLCFSLSTLFQLLTLPTEFNASHRAVEAIESQGVLNDEELYGCKKVLTAAAMTYVAALAVSVTQLLRLLSMVNRRRK
ncbi:MAG: zinc metallopeptidase [Clostridiales bacterium]|nr:zinc metallopeptidase [Clostridiales bacterium]